MTSQKLLNSQTSLTTSKKKKKIYGAVLHHHHLQQTGGDGPRRQVLVQFHLMGFPAPSIVQITLVYRSKDVEGPMVYGTCYSPLSHREYLEELGLADSKTLNEEQRERTFQKISDASEQIGWMVEILSPTYISNSMLKRSKYNLNALSHDSAIHLMQKVLDLGVNVAEVYVDTVGDPGKYQAKLKELFPSLEITVAKKADSTYPIVSAASICAKVVRDHALKEWTFVEGFSFSSDDYGSGYPNDPLTKKFLRGHMDKVFGFPHLVRFSWSTASLILDKEAVPMQWEDEEEEMNNSKNTPSLLTFFHKVPGSQEKYKQHKFFKDRCLSNLPDL